MKSFSFVIAVVFSIFLLKAKAQGPPLEWKFYFAFEDASGAKDTIWTCLDENGTFDVDTALGEVPVALDSTEFNVWIHHYMTGSTPYKLAARSLESSPEVEIYGMNAELPITLSWDTALFNAPVLMETSTGPICNPRMDSQWFFFQTNAPWLHHQYSMIFDNQVVLSESGLGSTNHFPITAYFDRGYDCNPLSNNVAVLKEFLLSPNPCTDYIELRTDAVLKKVEVYDLNGRLVLSHSGFGFGGRSERMRLDVGILPTGMYLIKGSDAQGRVGVRKFVKGH